MESLALCELLYFRYQLHSYVWDCQKIYIRFHRISVDVKDKIFFQIRGETMTHLQT